MISVCHVDAQQFVFRFKPGNVAKATDNENSDIEIILNDFTFGPYKAKVEISPISFEPLATVTGDSVISSSDLEWTVTGLPAGLVVNNGVLSGIPIQEGPASMTITASHNDAKTPASRTYDIVIDPAEASSCYDPSNIGKVGTGPECDGMLIVNKGMLTAAVADGTYQINHEGTIFTLSNSEHKVFTGQVTDLTLLFFLTNFNGDISYWDTSNVTSMRSMFQMTPFNQNISSWNTSKVTDMRRMFASAGSFNQNIGSWRMSNVTDISEMFSGAAAFNQDIGSWNVSNVTKMYATFFGASAFNRNISSWNTSKVTDMSSLFYYASSFNQPIGNWDTSNVTTMQMMFLEAGAFNQDIGSWDISNVSDMSYMFGAATSFNGDLSCWDVERFTKPYYFDNNARSWSENRKPRWGQAPSC